MNNFPWRNVTPKRPVPGSYNPIRSKGSSPNTCKSHRVLSSGYWQTGCLYWEAVDSTHDFIWIYSHFCNEKQFHGSLLGYTSRWVDDIARRHGHVFRMALHNEGDWRMETWQRARQSELSCFHTPIPKLCNAILNTCQMPSRFYIIPSNVNKIQTHLLKPFIARALMDGHICRQNTLMFALVFCLNCVHAPPARAVTAISLWKIRFMTASAVS